MEQLSKYEHDLLTATKYDYSMPVSAAGVRMIAEIYEKATGVRKRDNASCGYCVLDLMRSAGRLYFEQKEAMEAEKPEPEEMDQPTEESAGNGETDSNQDQGQDQDQDPEPKKEPEPDPEPEQDIEPEPEQKTKGKGKK